MKLRKPTQCLRITCSQQLELKLDAESDAPEGTYRRVTLVIPASPEFVFSIDEPTPAVSGPNRSYNVPEFNGVVAIPFVLAPAQRIYGGVKQGGGQGFATMIVEFLED